MNGITLRGAIKTVMIPCYKICKDRGCSHWNEKLVDCSRLPDECEYAVEHLVSDRENQRLDGKWHGFCRFKWDNGKISYEGFKVLNEEHGFCRRFYLNGQVGYEGNYVDGKREGFWRGWHQNGVLANEGEYLNGKRDGYWIYWDDTGNEVEALTFVNGEKV